LDAKDLVPGLAGVPAAESAISYIDGSAGVLEYRGHPIEELASKSSFEEVAWLLLYGALPSRAELASFRARLAEARALPSGLLDVVAELPATGHPMDALQASFAALGMFSERCDFRDAQSADRACIRLIGAAPTLVAAFHRARSGAPFVAPDSDLDTAANFLLMVTGEEPDELAARVLDVALILHADHTMNASTFAARVVASTEADPYTVVSSAVGALTGPLHGGANERVLQSLESIGSPDDVPGWLEERLARKQRVMGFGHRVYKVKDPRAHAIEGLARRLFEVHGSTPLYDVARRLEDEVVRRLGDRGIHPNVDYFSGLVYQKLGIPTDLFTPVFAIARVAGWLAHWREQMADNKLFRPAQVYTGGHGERFVPLAER